MSIEIKLLQYVFHFRALTWREEFAIKYDPKKDRMRTQLAFALDEVSGLKVKTVEEAWKVLNVIPQSVISRVFILYKAELPEGKLFTTIGLYKAPEPNQFTKRLEQVEQHREEVFDKVTEEMVEKFGREEIEEAKATERIMAKNSKLRGVTPASPDRPPEKN